MDPASSDDASPLLATLAQIVATSVVLCCNFLMSRIWAFSDRPRRAS